MAAQISQGKARTAALFQRPTRFFEEVINKGRTAMSALPDFTPLQGGVPLVFAGQVIGAIGVSGAASAQADEDIAQAAAKSVASAFGAGPPESAKPAPASFIDGAQVAAAFAKGEPLVEVAAYKIHASRRDKPGVAELHTRDTDIIYVLDGSAALVTGGTLVDGKASAADEVRGAAIEGGETRRLRKGDVVVVPHGTPHWFKEVPGPLTYYVVKVTAAEACHAGCGAGGAQ
jgi:glc operon protein GlcG